MSDAREELRHHLVDVLCGFAECNDSYNTIADRITDAAILANPDVVLRALGGFTNGLTDVGGDLAMWWFPKSADQRVGE